MKTPALCFIHPQDPYSTNWSDWLQLTKFKPISASSIIDLRIRESLEMTQQMLVSGTSAGWSSDMYLVSSERADLLGFQLLNDMWSPTAPAFSRLIGFEAPKRAVMALYVFIYRYGNMEHVCPLNIRQKHRSPVRIELSHKGDERAVKTASKGAKWRPPQPCLATPERNIQVVSGLWLNTKIKMIYSQLSTPQVFEVDDSWGCKHH